MAEERIHAFLVEIDEDLHPATIDRLWAALGCMKDVWCVRKLDEVEAIEVREIHERNMKRQMKSRRAAIKSDSEN
jgi:hypothetical protein